MPAPSHESIQHKKFFLVDNDCKTDIGMGLTGAELRKVRAFIRSCRECFALKLIDLEGYKGKPVRIQLEDDHPVFRCPYNLSLSERKEVKLRCKTLLDAGMIELSDGEYACATIMLAKKDTFGNWAKPKMCKDYHPVNRKTKSNRYPMPMLKKLSNALGRARVFSILDMRLGYHQLPLRLEDRPKTAFWRVDDDGRDMLFHWKFLP